MEIFGTDRLGRLMTAATAGMLGVVLGVGAVRNTAPYYLLPSLCMLVGAWRFGRPRSSRRVLQDETVASMRTVLRPTLIGVALILAGVALAVLGVRLAELGVLPWLFGR